MRAIAAIVLLAGLAGVVWANSGDPIPTPAPTTTATPDSKSTKPGSNPRFDKLVREDLFAGFGGDEAALKRGLLKCEAALKDDPKHAEALVWRGAVEVFQASQLFGKNQYLSGLRVWNQGLKDMDDAVALAPNYPGVRIPRAAVLVPAARGTPKGMSQPLLVRILDDYESMAKLQADQIDKLGTHPLGELRMGLADVYRMMGESAKSQAQLELVKKQLPGTEYATRADEWLLAKPDAKLAHNCIGCHGQ